MLTPQNLKSIFQLIENLVLAEDTDYTDVAAVVLTDSDTKLINDAYNTKFGIPIFVVLKNGDKLDNELAKKVYRVIDGNTFDANLYSRVIENAANQYEEKILPPFFKALSNYVERGNVQFDCPGHQGGQYFRKHPAGRFLYEFYGENIFRSDICNADVALGDLLIHEGPAVDAEAKCC